MFVLNILISFLFQYFYKKTNFWDLLECCLFSVEKFLESAPIYGWFRDLIMNMKIVRWKAYKTAAVGFACLFLLTGIVYLSSKHYAIKLLRWQELQAIIAMINLLFDRHAYPYLCESGIAKFMRKED